MVSSLALSCTCSLTTRMLHCVALASYDQQSVNKRLHCITNICLAHHGVCIVYGEGSFAGDQADLFLYPLIVPNFAVQQV